jgi:hypothetical protein
MKEREDSEGFQEYKEWFNGLPIGLIPPRSEQTVILKKSDVAINAYINKMVKAKVLRKKKKVGWFVPLEKVKNA